MGTYERKVNQLKDLMRRKYKSAYNKSKEMDIDISSMTYLPFMKIIKMNIKRYKEIIRKKDILTRALSEAHKLNKSIIWE